MFKVKNKITRTTSVFSLLTLNIFHTFFSVSIFDFKQVYANWVTAYLN